MHRDPNSTRYDAGLNPVNTQYRIGEFNLDSMIVHWMAESSDGLHSHTYLALRCIKHTSINVNVHTIRLKWIKL